MAGRPKAKIDWDQVDKMLQAHCTGTEVASALGIHPNTLYLACQEEHKRDFSAYSQQNKESGKRLLKMKQFQIAMKGDRVMLIWLGKNYLEQADKTDINHSGDQVIKVKLPDEFQV